VVLLVADANDAPGALRPPARLAGAAHGTFDRRELVLVHRDTIDRPRQTRRWLEALKVDAWHHVRLGRPGDIARVARFLTGRAVALALAGGGARGFVHLGALRALRELGIPVDLVCGTSIGSMIGGLVALGHDDESASELIRRWLVDRSPLDFRLPLLSLARGRNFDQLTEAMFGDADAEDAWSRYFCVSCSVTRATAVVHRTGPLRNVVRASCALPGVLPPVEINGELLVDGVFLNNLPAEEAQREAGRTIAVNVLPPQGGEAWAKLARDDGPLRQVARMLHPKAQVRMPPILQLVLQGIFLGPMQSSARIARSVDVFIEPPVGNYWFLDFQPFEEIRRLGYETARRELEAWLERPGAASERIAVAGA
jgi:predicted acylesterase/phospholipase RssA